MCLPLAPDILWHSDVEIRGFRLGFHYTAGAIGNYLASPYLALEADNAPGSISVHTPGNKPVYP